LMLHRAVPSQSKQRTLHTQTSPNGEALEAPLSHKCMVFTWIPVSDGREPIIGWRLLGPTHRQLWMVTLGSQRGVPGHLVVDSDLDAFSQYPSHDSIATPVYRLIADTRGAA